VVAVSLDSNLPLKDAEIKKIIQIISL
jgi:hypothetical protein